MYTSECALEFHLVLDILGHLCESVASGDIFDFCWPVLSQPCILFEVLIHFKGPRDRYPDLRPFQSILFHVASSHSCLSCRYLLMFTTLYMHSNLVKKVRCNFYPIHQDSHFHRVCKESFLQCLHIPIIHKFSELFCQFVCITVESTPQIKIFIWPLIILVCFHPSESMPKR